MADYYVGEIRLFAGGYAPVQWSYCNGNQIQISQNNVLFTLLGTSFGGNGVTNFNLPDLRSRVPIHQGQGANLTNRPFASQGGTSEVTLAMAEMPAHSHTLYASTATGTAQIPAGSVPAKVSPGAQYVTNNAPSKLTMASTMVSYAGNSQPHENHMPTMALSYIIALQGLFPVRN
jgi:microcystin-dependent protein